MCSNSEAEALSKQTAPAKKAAVKAVPKRKVEAPAVSKVRLEANKAEAVSPVVAPKVILFIAFLTFSRYIQEAMFSPILLFLWNVQ